jgi:hypothetical protein
MEEKFAMNMDNAGDKAPKEGGRVTAEDNEN